MKQFLSYLAVAATAMTSAVYADTTSELPDVVYELPAGAESSNYLREGDLFRQWGADNIRTEPFAATLATVAHTADGKIYISNAISGGTSGYLIGNREGDKVTLTFPQALAQGESVLTLMRLEPSTIQEDFEGLGISRPTYKIFEGSQDIVFTIKDEVLTQEPDTWFGFVQPDGTWAGYGEFNQIYTPFKEKPVVAPEDGERFNVGLRYTEEYRGEPYVYKLLSGLRKDNAVYVRGWSVQYPESWVKGTIEGDRVVFANGQLLGTDRGMEFFCTGYDTPEFIPGYNEWAHNYTITPSLEMAYDPATGEITALDKNDVFLISASRTNYGYGVQYTNPYMRPQPEVIEPKPLMPLFTRGVNTWDNGMEPFLTFQIRPMNVNGDVIDTEQLGFCINTADGPYVFTEFDYWLPEDLTIVPWGNHEPFINVYYNGFTSIEFQDMFLRNVSIRTVNTVDGVAYYSDPQYPDNPVTQNPSVGVGSLEETASPVISTVYYDLEGRRVERPSKGLYIRVNTHDNGHTDFTKIAF